MADGDQDAGDQLQMGEDLKEKQMKWVRSAVFSHP
jgi:hypothetical protein